MPAHAAIRGLHAHHAAKRRRKADGAARIRTYRGQRQPPGYRASRPAARTPRNVALFPGILGISEMPVAPRRPHGEFRHVEFSHVDGAGLIETLPDARNRVRRRVVLKHHASASRGSSRNKAEVLVGHGNAVERAEFIAKAESSLGFPRRPAQPSFADVQIGPQMEIPLLDEGEGVVDDFDRRDLTGAVSIPKRRYRPIAHRRILGEGETGYIIRFPGSPELGGRASSGPDEDNHACRNRRCDRKC